MLAQYGNEFGRDIRVLAFPVAFNTYPIDGPPLRRFLFSGNANVVLSVTGHDTSLASGTTVEINDHAPSIWLFFICFRHDGSSFIK
jgi:hypothetical protein